MCVCFIFRCPSTDAMALAKEQSVTAAQITLELILFKFLGSPKLEIFCNLNGCETADDTRCLAVSVIFNPLCTTGFFLLVSYNAPWDGPLYIMRGHIL